MRTGTYAVAAARRRHADDRRVEVRIEELLARWRAGEQVGSAAKALDLPVAACRSVIARRVTEVDRAARRAGLMRAGGAATSYSDRDIIVAVCLVTAHLGRVPTRVEYRALARELGCPCLTTVANRMRGWTNAVRGAGLTPARPPRPRSRGCDAQRRRRTGADPDCRRL